MEILGYRLKEEDSMTICKHWEKIYNNISNEIKVAEKHRIRQKLLQILKGNSVQNISELNKAILGLLKDNIDFRNSFLNKYKLVTDGKP